MIALQLRLLFTEAGRGMVSGSAHWGVSVQPGEMASLLASNEPAILRGPQFTNTAIQCIGAARVMAMVKLCHHACRCCACFWETC